MYVANKNLISELSVLWLVLLSLCIPGLLTGQNGEELLERGREAYEYDQLDSARFYYALAGKETDANIRTKALSGLIKVSILESQMDKADSLVGVADELVQTTDLDRDAEFGYKVVRGEYLRNNSRFREALTQQQEVIGAYDNDQEADLNLANALFYAGLTYENLGLYDSSLYYVDKAYPIFRQTLDSTDLRFSGIYNGMGVCYFRANKLEEAKNWYQRSMAVAREKLGPVSTDLAFCLNNLAAISRSQENYEEAVDYSEQALSILRQLEDEAGMSGAYYNLGINYYFLGDYGRCRDYMEACIAIRKRLYNESHHSLINPYEVLGITLEQAGNYEQTLKYLKKASPIIRENYGAGSIREAFNYENLATGFQSIGQLDSALHYIKKADRILEPAMPPDDYSMATHYFIYGTILLDLEQYDASNEMLQRSNRVFEVLGLFESLEYAQNLAFQGTIASMEEQWDRADELFSLALERIITESDMGIESAEAYQLSPNTLSILNVYLEYLYRKYRVTFDAESLEQFERYARLYLDMSDRFRKQFIDPYTKSALIKESADVYDRAIGAFNQLYLETGDEKYLREAYRFSEYGRTSMLRDMQDDKIKTYAGVSDSLLERERTLRKAISELEQEVLNYPDSVALKTDLFREKQTLNALIERLEASNPRYYALKYQRDVPTLEEVQQRLVSGENLIEFMQDDSAYYALILRPKDQALVALGERRGIDSLVQAWRQKISNPDIQEITALSNQLYTRLWKHIEKHIDGDRAIVIPVGRLFYIPFETICREDKPGSYLIHDYTFSYALSINSLLTDRGPVENTSGKVLVVAPGFEDDLKEQYRSNLPDNEVVDLQYIQTVRQPWSIRLAEDLAARYQSREMIGLAASEESIRQYVGTGKVLFFGTHAIANEEDPLRSKLVLAKSGGEEDGYLHAYEIYGLPLNAELAVLHACESGLGQVQRGEGMISLAYSLQYAGCPSTVMSLWKVDEKVNTRIVRTFMGYLDQGMSRSEALRQAKLDHLENADMIMAHPFYWGGMVLQGIDGPVDFKKKVGRWPIYLLLGLGILGVLYFRLR